MKRNKNLSKTNLEYTKIYSKDFVKVKVGMKLIN